MDIETHKTTNHQTIEHWVTNRNGKPIRLREENNDPGLGPIAIYFPDIKDKADNAEEIPWTEFFDFFEDKKLAFFYKENEADGSVSYYYRIENR